jgi:ABC-type sugar transport system permease subunit
LRALILIPWAIPTVVNGTIWKYIFDANYGALSGLLFSLGLIKEYIPFLGSPFLALNSVILADVWNMTPFVALILLAGLQSVPEEVIEAARVDGAESFKILFKIILPLLKPTILVVLILRTLGAFKVFDIIYVLTHGGPANGTKVLSYLTYQESFEFLNFGYGAALSYSITIFTAILAILYLKFLYQEESVY